MSIPVVLTFNAEVSGISSASGGVTSFAGRVGAVVPLQNDYDAFFLTQAEANAQGMTPIELGSVVSTGPVREVNANFILRAAVTSGDFYQLYVNTGTSAVTAAPPSGYLATLGISSSITPGSAALFVKRAGVLQFRRVS